MLGSTPHLLVCLEPHAIHRSLIGDIPRQFLLNIVGIVRRHHEDDPERHPPAGLPDDERKAWEKDEYDHGEMLFERHVFSLGLEDDPRKASFAIRQIEHSSSRGRNSPTGNDLMRSSAQRNNSIFSHRSSTSLTVA